MERVVASERMVGPKGVALGRVAKGAMALALVAGVIGLGRLAGAQLPALRGAIEALGPGGPIAFVLLYAIAVVAFVPGAALTLMAGALFGVVKGSVLVLAGATLGSTGAFCIARHLAREAIARRVQGNPRFVAIDHAIGQRGRRIVLLLRLSPVFPFTLLNYALGLTRVRLADYVTGAIGMIPGTVLYVYSGSLASDVALVAAGTSAAPGMGTLAVAAIGFVATLAVTITVTRIARRALDAASRSVTPAQES